MFSGRKISHVTAIKRTALLQVLTKYDFLFTGLSQENSLRKVTSNISQDEV